MTGNGIAPVLNAVSDQANSWICLPCAFFRGLVNADSPANSCLLVKIVYHREAQVEEEGGQCLFRDMMFGPWAKADVSQFTGSSAFSTPCGKKYISLYKE